MKRRDFVTHLGLGAGAAAASALSACSKQDQAGNHGQGERADSQRAAASATKRVQWRLASSFPRGLEVIYGTGETLAKLVEEMTDGKFRIRCYPAGELVPGLQVMDAVQQGTVQCGHSASYYYIGKHPAFAFDAAVPYGLSARQQIAWLLEAGGGELLAPLFADFNIVRFFGGNTGVQMGGWFKRELADVADLKGLKMRIPGLGGDVMSRLGATVQVLAGGDIYPALERGAIDATEWIGPYDDEKLGFYKVAKHYYYPGWWEPGPALTFYVNKKAWESLPSQYQVVFSEAARAAGLRMQAQYDAKNPAALRRLRKQGVQLHPFPDSVMRASKRESEALLTEHAAKDATYQKIYQAWNKFRQESSDWFGTAELAFSRFAYASG